MRYTEPHGSAGTSEIDGEMDKLDIYDADFHREGDCDWEGDYDEEYKEDARDYNGDEIEEGKEAADGDVEMAD
jgi:hypothetical protein